VPAPIKSSEWVRGPELAASLRSDQVERGAELFRRGEDFTLGGVLACASCHPEGRSDGLSWRLGRAILQTPMLAGRVEDTGPYKWTGEDSSLRESFTHTLERIGGSPLDIKASDFTALAAYITSLPKPRPPSITDAEALARGQKLFERECAACHAGEKTTDRGRHEFATTLRKVDTPSLIGLAHSAPYYHDGSAIDLAALLDDRGSIHDMIDTSALTADERRDLITFLESL
jgi:cytochrome c553